MQYYWELEQFDGTTTAIPPQSVDKVKQWLQNGQPVLLKSAVIPANQVKSFRVTSRAYSDQALLTSAARAFQETQYTDDGSVLAHWMKRSVTQRDYSRHYSHIPGYRKLDEDGNHVWVAMLLPAEADTLDLQYCTQDEIRQLERNRRNH